MEIKMLSIQAHHRLNSTPDVQTYLRTTLRYVVKRRMGRRGCLVGPFIYLGLPKITITTTKKKRKGIKMEINETTDPLKLPLTCHLGVVVFASVRGFLPRRRTTKVKERTIKPTWIVPRYRTR
ncbi:hypothetical protein LZ30DRAFT_165344 [Colletotrichum cereale]|nr:hypothetical protein LZ30DRAFT_165344 [Colletotrichum cereale]